MKKLILPASEKRHPVAAYLAYLLSLYLDVTYREF